MEEAKTEKNLHYIFNIFTPNIQYLDLASNILFIRVLLLANCRTNKLIMNLE